LPPDLGDIGRYVRATDAHRAAAKWLLAALAAVGAVLIAGLQVARLGGLEPSSWARQVGGLAAALLALLAVGYMIAATSRVFTDEWVTLAELADETIDEELRPTPSAQRLRLLEDLRAKIDNERQLLYRHVADSVPDLHRVLRRANDAARAAGSQPAQRADLARALAWVRLVRATAGEVTDCANYHRTRVLLRRLRPRLAWGAALTVVAVLVFAYATNPPDRQGGPVKVQLVPATATP
jgi:hypothetical protein